MATRVTTTLVDDTDGSEAVETLTFGIDSVQYELDLSEQNAKKLREALAPWVTQGPQDRRPALQEQQDGRCRC
jgi:hypothetical protein